MATTPADEDDIEPPPESGVVAPMQEAAAELALSERRVGRMVTRMMDSLTPKERAAIVARWQAPKKRRPS
jgi:DNA-directed RNA polymerase specialized sigma24 family protein